MKLFTSPRAPNPKRVRMFMAEKGLGDDAIELVNVDLNTNQHKTPDFVLKSAMSRIPALELDDGRMLCESRAICTYLEALYPAPNLMGETGEQRAFIEMTDRYVEWYIMIPLAMWIRHTHPGLAVLEGTQFPDFGQNQAPKFEAGVQWLDGQLAKHDWVAGDVFSIADITAFCALEFARLAKFKAADKGFANVARWHAAMSQRASAPAGNA